MSTKWRVYSSAVARKRKLVRSISGGVRQSEGGHLHVRTQEQNGPHTRSQALRVTSQALRVTSQRWPVLVVAVTTG